MLMTKKFFICLLALLMIGVSVATANTSNLPGSGWTSGQQIQNVSTTNNAQVSLTAYAANGTSYPCDNQSLAPGASFTWLADNCTSPAGFQGSAVASSDQPIVAVVNVNNRSVGGAAGQYTGTDGSAASTTIAFPLVKNNHSNRTTTFYVQNASSSASNMTATFKVAGNIYTKEYNNVPPSAMVVINPSDAGVPSGQGNIGSLSVVGTQPLAGASLEHETTAAVAQNLQASRAFVPSDYASTLYCPLLRHQFGSQSTTTGLQVQNVSGSAQNISVTYNVVFGPGAPATVGPITVNNVADGASANFLSSDHLQPGQLASATVTSGGNIAAVVNDRATNPTPNRFTTYACFAATKATTNVSLPLVKENFNHNTTGIQVQNVGNAAATFTLTYKTHTGATVVITHSDAVAPGSSKTFYRVSSGGTTGLIVNSGLLSSLDSTVNGVVITSSQPIVAIANENNYTGMNIQDTKNYEGFNQ
jgi:hypothetical protein